MRISLAMSAVMLAGKLTAYTLTLSRAVLADAAESVVHGVATGLAAFSLWYASKPADREHPYGHGRIAYFSAGIEGMLVFAAAVTVIYSGVQGLIVGVTLKQLGWGLGISIVLAAINLVLGFWLIRVGRQTNTLILIANGKHVLSDAWTTIAAIGGLTAVLLTGLEWLDPAVAIAIGGMIMWSGAEMIRESFVGLMDRVDDETTAKLIDAFDEQVGAGRITAYHELRCRQINDELAVDVHLLLPGAMSLEDAHERATEVEHAIAAAFSSHKLHVTSHLEPDEHGEAHPEGHSSRADPLGTASDPIPKTQS